MLISEFLEKNFAESTETNILKFLSCLKQEYRIFVNIDENDIMQSTFEPPDSTYVLETFCSLQELLKLSKVK